MSSVRTHLFLQRAIERELHFCLRVNQSLGRPVIQGFFSVISRLGDGLFWYGLIVLLPIIFGLEALRVSFLMVIAGVLNLLIYKTIKQLTCRQRPCTSNSQIIPGAHLLDHYSFPSGHTLHAAGFTTLVLHFLPALGLILIPFVILIAMSRVILGLHFPTDVIAGALIGTVIANLSIHFFNPLLIPF